MRTDALSPRIKKKVSDMIGRTPLLDLPVSDESGRVLLKLEQYNPTGTAKIRMARQMIEDAEAEGRLKPGGWIVESTSGNTGLGLALVAAEKGYRFTAVVDHHAAPDKLRAMQAYGAELVFVGDSDGSLATADRDAMAARIAAENGAYWTQQHNNPANAQGYHLLALELLEDLGDDIHCLFGAIGTGGSLCGTARALKEQLPKLRVVGVEPEGSIIFGGTPAAYFQSGTGTPAGAEIGSLIDYVLIDEGLKVTDSQAFETARYLARHHAVLVGGSAGGVVYRALLHARNYPNSTTVVLVCDGGEKYMDTIYDRKWMSERNLHNEAIIQELRTLLPH